jgi:pre-mRNA-processing factor 39
MEKPEENEKRVKHVCDEMRTRTHMTAQSERGLCQVYLKYLVERGSKDAMKTFLKVDREVFGLVPHAMIDDGVLELT